MKANTCEASTAPALAALLRSKSQPTILQDGQPNKPMRRIRPDVGGISSGSPAHVRAESVFAHPGVDGVRRIWKESGSRIIKSMKLHIRLLDTLPTWYDFDVAREMFGTFAPRLRAEPHNRCATSGNFIFPAVLGRQFIYPPGLACPPARTKPPLDSRSPARRSAMWANRHGCERWRPHSQTRRLRLLTLGSYADIVMVT